VESSVKSSADVVPPSSADCAAAAIASALPCGDAASIRL
jgi:hypothetical protein